MAEVNFNLPEPNEARGSADVKIREGLAKLKELVNGKLNHENLEARAAGIQWYAPKIIATEESRENVAFGKLTTPDEITGVVLPENGLIVVGYQALWSHSTSGALAKAAIFIGANQLKIGSVTTPIVQQAEGAATDTSFTNLFSTPQGLEGLAEVGGASQVTTGQILGGFSGFGAGTAQGGMTYIFGAAGTYAVSVQFRASAGKVTAKERKLWVATLGY